MQIYTYVRTMAVKPQINSRWTERANAQETLLELCLNERTALVIVFNTISAKQEAYSIEHLRNSSVDLSQTIDLFLQSIDNTALETIDVPTIKPRLVRYANAIRCGYKADLVQSGYADDAPLSSASKNDLKLTRPGISYNDFNKNCLLSINGFFHYSDVTSQGIYVNEAMKSVRVSGYNQVGLYNFSEVGTLDKYPLSTADIFPIALTAKLKDNFTIDIKVNASNKYAIFFIGGYMVPCTGNIITQKSDSTFAVAFNKFEWLDKFFEMSRFLDLKALDILASPTNENAFFKDEITADKTIRNLFKLPQSFVVLVDTPSFFVDKLPLAIAKLPGIYRNYGKFEKLPLQLGHGRMAEYWLAKDDGKTKSDALYVADGYKFQRNYNSADADAAIVVDPKRPAGHRIDISDAWLLSMGRDF